MLCEPALRCARSNSGGQARDWSKLRMSFAANSIGCYTVFYPRRYEPPSLACQPCAPALAANRIRGGIARWVFSGEESGADQKNATLPLQTAMSRAAVKALNRKPVKRSALEVSAEK